MNKPFISRMLAIGAGSSLLLGVGAAAIADTEHGQDDIDINVEIAQVEEPGVLAMTVAANSMELTEADSDELVRQFSGTLPTVTVTDTRAASDISEGAAWYVLGTASDFSTADGSGTIEARHLGWKPQLLDGGDSGLVTEGEEVGTAMDASPDNVGLVDQELLAMAFDSQAVNEEGSWTANAELFLRTPATVEPGSYGSKLTLSLFE